MAKSLRSNGARAVRAERRLRMVGNPTMVAREASTSEAMARVLEKGRARQAELAKARAAAASANPVPMEAAPTMADDKASAAAAAALRVRGGRAGKKDRRRAGNAAAAGDASLPHPLAPGGIHQFHPMKPKGKKRLRTSIFTRHG